MQGAAESLRRARDDVCMCVRRYLSMNKNISPVFSRNHSVRNTERDCGRAGSDVCVCVCGGGGGGHV